MKALRGDGGQIDAEATLIEDQTFQLSFGNPMAEQIKYTITVLNNRWTEIGKMSRDSGKSWNKYFEMTFDKQ